MIRVLSKRFSVGTGCGIVERSYDLNVEILYTPERLGNLIRCQRTAIELIGLMERCKSYSDFFILNGV